MDYEAYQKVKPGAPCVIIQTGELGKVLSVNRDNGDIYLAANRAGLGFVKQWFHYTHLADL